MAREFDINNNTNELKERTTNVAITEADNIQAKTKQAFILAGFNLQRLKPNEFQVLRLLRQDSDNELVSNKIPPEQSFGLPIFTNLEFEAGSFQTLDGDIIEFQELRLDSVLMTVTMSKNIVKTAIQGKSGTVKEYVSDGDFEIDVRGVLVGNGHNVYPEDETERLTNLLTIPEKLKITSEFLDHFGVISPEGMPGISEVIIESFSFPQSKGFRNVQLFQFKMLSDTPIELTI